MSDFADRLFQVQTRMAVMGLDGLIVTSADPHLSEYPAEAWKFREYLSGFTGSAGILVFLADEAGLWTDSRYFVQAEKELKGTGIELYKMGQPDTPDYKQWIISRLNIGSVVGINGKTISVTDYRELLKKFKEADLRLDPKADLMDELWDSRPVIPEDEVYEHLPVHAGLSRRGKIEMVQDEMRKLDISHYVVSALDEIAWLLNLRGSDVAYNPVFHAYVVVTLDQVGLFIDTHKITGKISKALNADNVKIYLYNDFYDYLNEIPTLSTVFLDPDKTNSIVFTSLPSQAEKKERLSIITQFKSIKSEGEIKNLRVTMQHDGAAMVKFI